MRFRNFALSLVLVAALCAIIGCEKDLVQVLFHPSIDDRFSDSTSGQLTVAAPATVNPEHFNFAIFGDPHQQADGTSLMGRFTSDIATHALKFFVVLGDLTEDGNNAEFSMMKTSMDNTGIPYYATIGNHDLFQGWGNGGWNTWKSTFGPATYSVTIASNVRFIFLDTATGEIGDRQFQWLQDQLATAVKYTFVCSHYGIFDGATPNVWRLESFEERYRLSSMLNSAGVYAYVAGHLHAFNHSMVGNVQHFIIGSMHPVTLDYGSHGYVLFSYNSGNLTWTNVTFD